MSNNCTITLAYTFKSTVFNLEISITARMTSHIPTLDANFDANISVLFLAKTISYMSCFNFNPCK